MSGQIFISYRRDDAAPWARLVYTSLFKHFPQSQIFMDVDNLDPGIDFVEAIKASVGCCDVLIAVIGKHWLVSADEEGRRRIDNPEDFVRIEIGAVVLIGLAILRVQPPAPNSLISPPSIPIVSGPAPSEGKQPAGQPSPSRGGAPQSGGFRQETRVAGVVAELTRFVRSGNLITAEVTLRNAGSLPAKFSCDDWQLIDEQTGDKSSPAADGGRVSPFSPETLAPGATHVAWAKFKAQAGDLSGGKYSVNIESILNRPFEGLAPNRAVLPQPSQQETRVAGVVAELTRFVRAGNLITAEVTFRNVGSLPAKFSCDDWQLIDEQTGDKSSPAADGGRVSPSSPETLASTVRSKGSP
jgi:hypothetical protein